HLREDDPRLVSSIAGLAAMYSIAGYDENAEQLFQQGLAIRRRAPDAEQCHSAYSMLLYELGRLRYHQGAYRGAEHYGDAAIARFARTLGPDPVITVDHLAMRVLVWRELGRYAEAEALARHSLERRSALHEAGSLAIDNALHHLASVLLERGRLDEAMALEN